MSRDDTDVSASPVRSTRDTGIVREDREVGEPRLVDPQIEFAREEARAAGCIHEALRAHRLQSSAVRRLHGDAGTGVIERDVDDAMALADVRAARRRMTKEQLVELRARHLPRLWTRDAGSDAEVGEAFDAAVSGHERRAPLFRKAGAADQRVRADRDQRIVGRREERLADVEPGKLIPLEDDDAVSGAREPRRRRRSRRPAARDDDVAIPRHGGVVCIKWRTALQQDCRSSQSVAAPVNHRD